MKSMMSDSVIHQMLFLVVGLLAFVQPDARSQELQWESRELKFNPSLTDSNVVGRFKFKNVGTADVKITDVSTSCSCAKPEWDKKDLPPGASGEVTVSFAFGTRTGLQENPILVKSNDLKRPLAVLMMKINIPEMAQMRPNFLYWPPEEPLSSKTITFEVLNNCPVKTVTAESSHPKINAKVKVVKKGREYRIVITPEKTDQPIVAKLTIKTDYPPENPKVFYANVRVEPQK